ncbi:MAG: hypothetical protein ACUVQ1_03070 [Candidatus Kapaibacteriales bacterium]
MERSETSPKNDIASIKVDNSFPYSKILFSQHQIFQVHMQVLYAVKSF